MLRSLKKTFRRIRYGEPVVVVSGLPRSGTSMAMRMLQAGGVPLVEDGERTADVDNPKGYFEDERVKNLGEAIDKSWVRRSRGKAIKVISYLLKELPRDNNYRVVFMRRNLTEVLASQAKMLDRRGERNDVSDQQMIEVFESHLWRTDYFFRRTAPHMERLELQYHEVIADPHTAARRIAAFLDGDLDVEQMAAAVDRGLYRNRAEELEAASAEG